MGGIKSIPPMLNLLSSKGFRKKMGEMSDFSAKNYSRSRWEVTSLPLGSKIAVVGK